MFVFTSKMIVFRIGTGLAVLVICQEFTFLVKRISCHLRIRGDFPSMNIIRTIALCWLVFLAGFLGGLYVYETRVWPYSLLKNIQNFVAGHASENLSLIEKIENDFNFTPTRHINVNSAAKTFESEKHKELEGLSLNPRRKKPKIFLSHNAPDGYRVIIGTFDFDEVLHGVIMLDPEGRVAHVWHISQEGLDWEHPKDTNVFPHGFEIAPDGSVVTAFDEGNSIAKYDYCGNVVWDLEGRFHHSIAFEGDEAIWGWEVNNLLKIDYHTGEVLKKIPLQKVMDANPNIDIFGILQADTREGSSWLDNPWHPNDIDPLPEELEQYYPGFSAGDLLVSLRSPNLIFVMDQETFKVKWWRQGLTRRQHDPDWNDKGTITIFNNNTTRGYCNITELNPVTYEYDVLVYGEPYNFYTMWRGKHQMMPEGGFLITSSDQGRVFETNGEGTITFEFLNTYGDKKEHLAKSKSRLFYQEYMAVSEARFLPKDFFKDLPQCE